MSAAGFHERQPLPTEQDDLFAKNHSLTTPIAAFGASALPLTGCSSEPTTNTEAARTATSVTARAEALPAIRFHNRQRQRRLEPSHSGTVPHSKVAASAPPSTHQECSGGRYAARPVYHQRRRAAAACDRISHSGNAYPSADSGSRRQAVRRPVRCGRDLTVQHPNPSVVASVDCMPKRYRVRDLESGEVLAEAEHPDDVAARHWSVEVTSKHHSRGWILELADGTDWLLRTRDGGVRKASEKPAI